jgi:hypothetical protein
MLQANEKMLGINSEEEKKENSGDDDNAEEKQVSAEVKESLNKKAEEEKVERAQPDILSLQKDIYSYTFHTFCNSQNAVKVSELMMMCFATFTIQLTIVMNKYMETSQD